MTKTFEELCTIAMLLGEGWWYDSLDHTFNLPPGKTMCADTMELIDNVTYAYRRAMVERGEMGLKDTELEKFNDYKRHNFRPAT